MSIPPLFTLRDLARPSPAAAIVVCNGQRQAQVTTYSDLVSQAIGAAADFLADVPKLTVVAMCMGNTKEFVATYLGITAYANCVALPLNPTTSRAEAQSTLQDSGAKVLFADDAGSASCVVAGELGLRVVVVAASTFSARRANAAVYVDRPPHPADTALLLFTSGTTAKPKLVPLSHHNLVTSIANIRNTYQLDERDSSYLVMPLFHIHGLQSALCATLASGGTVLLPAAGKFSANVFWRDVVEHKATWYTAVPTIHQILLARADTDRALIAQARLRFIRSCSASLAPATLEKLEQVTKAVVLEAYAMSEAAHQMTSNPLPVNGPRKPGSVGRGTNVQISVRDEAMDDVCVRGENVTAGYLDRPEANAESFQKGWFRTGDNGYLDKDGYLFLTGRLKEIVNRGGEKISPIEIDAILLEHPLVAEGVAFGLPSEKYGEVLACCVVPAPGASLTPENVVDYLAKKVSREKVPAAKHVFIVKEIPKSNIGKVQRRNLTAVFNSKL